MHPVILGARFPEMCLPEWFNSNSELDLKCPTNNNLPSD